MLSTHSDPAIAPQESSKENATNSLSASTFTPSNDSPSEPMTRLMALRITMRRVQRSTHSFETELLAMHSRKAPDKHRFAASEFAVSKSASRCKPARSHSNSLTNSSLQAYSLLARVSCLCQRTLLTLLSPYSDTPSPSAST